MRCPVAVTPANSAPPLHPPLVRPQLNVHPKETEKNSNASKVVQLGMNCATGSQIDNKGPASNLVALHKSSKLVWAKPMWFLPHPICKPLSLCISQSYPYCAYNKLLLVSSHAAEIWWNKCIVNPREEYIFLNLHTTSAKQELTAGPAKLHSQIFYHTTGGFIDILFTH